MRISLCFAFLGCALAAPLSASVADKLPAWFEPAPGGRGFVSRGSEGSLVLTGAEARIHFEGSPDHRAVSLDWRLIGADREATLEGLDPLEAKSSYFIGRGREDWRIGVPHFARARARQVYPGVDAVWYANGRNLEYDFVVAPGADPSRIRLRLDGGSSPQLTAEGDLIVNAGGLTIRQHSPEVYQQIDGRRVQVAAAYKLGRNGEVGFTLGAYDPSHALVIDPVFSYAGSLGGTRLDVANGVVMDAAGALWITGSAQSQLELPEGLPSYNKTNKGRRDIFLARILPAEGGGGRLDYYAYIGGTQDDEASAITMDAAGVIYITGWTGSLDFPLAGNAYQTTNDQNDVEAVVLRFDPRIEGEFALTYSSYYGGKGREYPKAIAVSANGLVGIAGYTNSGELPEAARTALQPSNRGGNDAFFVVFNPLASTAPASVVLASFLGGNSTDIANGIAFDAQGRILLTGVTMSDDYPYTPNAVQPARDGSSDLFFAIVNPALSGLDQLQYATYYGRGGLDYPVAAKLDGAGRLWITGYTTSTNFFTTQNAYQFSRPGSVSAFLMAVDPAKSASGDFLVYSTYFGGDGAEIPYGLGFGPNGQVAIAGYSVSNFYPVKNSPVPPPDKVRLTESFFASFDPARSGKDSLLLSARYGGSSTDVATGIAFDAAGNIGIAGYTGSSDLPTASPTGKLSPFGVNTGWYLRLAADSK